MLLFVHLGGMVLLMAVPVSWPARLALWALLGMSLYQTFSRRRFLPAGEVLLKSGLALLLEKDHDMVLEEIPTEILAEE